MRVLAVVFVFLFVGALFVVSNENLHLSEREDFSKFYGMYYNWIASLLGNFKNLTLFVVKFDWIPKEINESN